MENIILEIMPQSKNLPYLFLDYIITVNLPNKRLNIHTPKMDMITACNIAIMIAQALEFVGKYDVRFSTYTEDKSCTAYIAAYRNEQENGTCYGNNKHQNG